MISTDMNPKRILFLSSWYPDPEHPTLGIFVQRHAEALVASGLEVTVISHRFGDGDHITFTEEEARMKGLKEIRINIPKSQGGLFQKSIFFFRQRNILIDFLKNLRDDFKPHLLQINVAYPMGALWWFFRDYFPTSILLAEHWSGYLPEDGRYKGIFCQLITQSVVRKSSAILTVSSKHQRAMEQHGLKGKYLELPNVIDERIFRFQPRAVAGNFRFIHVSSLNPLEKNPEMLLRAFARLQKQVGGVELIMVGDNRERIATLKSYANALGIGDWVSWKGPLDAVGVAQELLTSHAFVLASNFEGQPVVLLEAMSTGIPIVAPAVGGIPEMVGEQEGILYPAGSEEELFLALMKIRSDYDRFRGDLISRKIQQKHGISAVASYFSSVYKQVLKHG
jgi:glycosyltransferase involved in cell wall biosynthesis